MTLNAVPAENEVRIGPGKKKKKKSKLANQNDAKTMLRQEVLGQTVCNCLPGKRTSGISQMSRKRPLLSKELLNT